MVVILSASCITPVSAALFKPDEITWISDRGDERKSKYKGELEECYAEATFDASTYSFKARETGYWFICGDYDGFDISVNAVGSTVTTYFRFGGTNGPDGMMWPADGGKRGYTVYLRKGEKVFISFFDTYGPGETAKAGKTASGTVCINRLGEIISAPDYIRVSTADGKLGYSYEDHHACLTDNIKIVFSQGGEMITDLLFFSLSSPKSGKHPVHVDIYDGRGFDMILEITNLPDFVRKVELPDGFTPEAKVWYNGYSLFYEESSCPAYLVIHFNDGTVRKVYNSKEQDRFSASFKKDGHTYRITANPELTAGGKVRWVVRESYYYDVPGTDIGVIASFEMKAENPGGTSDLATYGSSLRDSFIGNVRGLGYSAPGKVMGDTISSIFGITLAFLRYRIFSFRSGLAV